MYQKYRIIDEHADKRNDSHGIESEEVDQRSDRDREKIYLHMGTATWTWIVRN